MTLEPKQVAKTLCFQPLSSHLDKNKSFFSKTQNLRRHHKYLFRSPQNLLMVISQPASHQFPRFLVILQPPFPRVPLLSKKKSSLYCWAGVVSVSQFVLSPSLYGWPPKTLCTKKYCLVISLKIYLTKYQNWDIFFLFSEILSFFLLK